MGPAESTHYEIRLHTRQHASLPELEPASVPENPEECLRLRTALFEKREEIEEALVLMDENECQEHATLLDISTLSVINGGHTQHDLSNIKHGPCIVVTNHALLAWTRSSKSTKENS